MFTAVVEFIILHDIATISEIILILRPIYGSICENKICHRNTKSLPGNLVFPDHTLKLNFHVFGKK